MPRNTFKFKGGEELTTMGATWFTSYCYHEKLDDEHLNWNRVHTASMRRSTYCRTRGLHQHWLEQVLTMNDLKLEKNKLGLSSVEIKRMAGELLSTKT